MSSRNARSDQARVPAQRRSTTAGEVRWGTYLSRTEWFRSPSGRHIATRTRRGCRPRRRPSSPHPYDGPRRDRASACPGLSSSRIASTRARPAMSARRPPPKSAAGIVAVVHRAAMTRAELLRVCPSPGHHVNGSARSQNPAALNDRARRSPACFDLHRTGNPDKRQRFCRQRWRCRPKADRANPNRASALGRLSKARWSRQGSTHRALQLSLGRGFGLVSISPRLDPQNRRPAPCHPL